MRRPTRAAAVIALVLWILAGPLAAVFGACAAMGAMCEGPCGVGPCALLLIVSVAPILFVLGRTPLTGRPVPMAVVRLFDPPPRLILSA